MPKFAYGYKKDPEDARDFIFAATYSPERLPAQADHLIHMPSVRNQGHTLACCGFAERTQLEHMQRWNNDVMWEISPLFIYSMARQDDGTFPEDGGTHPRSVCKAAATYGVTQEADWPFDENNIGVAPTDSAKAKALSFKSLRYERVVLDPQHIQSAIWRGFTVVCGITVKSSFESQAVASDGMVPFPAPDEPVLGGHAIVLHGFDNNRKTLEGDYGMYHCQNSWGADWGENGHFWLPYKYVHSIGLTGDLWTVYAVSPQIS